MVLLGNTSLAQVINNDGAAIYVKPSTFVSSKDANNNTGGSLWNYGTINLSGNYTSVATTRGDGTISLKGNWSSTGGLFFPGNSTVIFNGVNNNQSITHDNVNFYNLTINNSSALPQRVSILNNITVLGTLTMSLGNIDAGTFIFYLNNPLAAALNYTSATGSRILGKFERGISEKATYLFPLGTISHYNPANLITNNIPVSGSVLSQFFAADPGSLGLPLSDPPVEISEQYKSGYWSFQANGGFTINNYNINLNATGFDSLVINTTRIIKRTSSGSWTIDGTHAVADTVNSVVFRNNLTGGISSSGTEFALGKARPLITSHPTNVIQCEHTDAIFSVTATGAAKLTYRWYKNGTIITDGPNNYSGARTPTLTVIDINLVDDGTYYCIVTDRYRNSTMSNSATLTVMKNPVATVSISAQDHECSDIPFEDIRLDLTWYDNPGTVFDWTRDNPTGITSGSIPMGGTYFNIGDVISGSFTDTIDTWKKVTFIVTPRGPTGCISKQPVTSTVTVNPTPRATPNNNLPAICFGTSTDVVMRTPTIMTRGVIDYDYFVTKTDASVTGNTTPGNRQENDHITYPYQNSSDTIKSVYYHITPKNTVSGCLIGDTVIAQVKIHPYPLKTITITKPLSCDGGSDASILVTTKKGADPYYIKWVGPYTYPFEGYGLTYLTGLRGGRYDIDVTDNLGCTTFNEDYITVSGARLDSRITPINKLPPSPGYDVTCWYNSDGSAWLRENTSSTGVPPFNYWVIHNNDTLFTGTLSAKGVIDTISGLESGNYQLYVEDKNHCSNLTETDIVPPDTIKISFIPKVYDGGFNVRCKGYNDGHIKTYITGGNGKFSGIYTYKWTTTTGSFTGPDNLDSLSNVSAGRYYLTVTDQMLCTVTDYVDIYEPDGMNLVSIQVSFSNDSLYNISCNGGNDGYINIAVTGGSGHYNYTWTDSVSYYAYTEDISGIPAGNYYCMVKDYNGCILMPYPSAALIEPAPLDITYIPSFSTSGGYNINCNGGTGTIDITVTGGSVGTYKYFWSTSNGSGIVQGNEDQFALTAGTYNLVVSDSNGCSTSIDITLTQPAALATNLNPTRITCAAPLLDNGAIDLTVAGGVTNYSYLWSNGPTSQDISNLTQGTYSVHVTDANGCTIDDTIIINNPPPVLYSKTLSDFNTYQVSCYGYSNGSIDITMTSGTPPYSYSWTGPAPFNPSSSQNISDLAAGQYTLVITDSMLCTAIETINLTQPGKLDMILDLTDILCAGKKTGAIEIEPVNEVVSVSYLWSDGSTQHNRRKLVAGDYGVILTDLNNCSIDSTVTLTEPDSIKLKFEVTQPWCVDKPDGEIKLTATGGVDGINYVYKWSDNSTSDVISDISGGWYSVKVTDLNNCSVRDSVYVDPLHETCLIIPNAISPNGDAINDVWNIGNKELYPGLEIKIFNRWGELIWKSGKGYPDPWDGTSNGRKLPIDSYHYIIDLHNGSKPLIGNVTIVR